MDRRRALAAAGLGGAALGLVALMRRLVPPPETRLHVVGPGGRVAADPEGLARAAGASLPSYALASAMQSEEETDRGRLAVGRASWNAAREDRRRLVRLLLSSGGLGDQAVNPYAATSRPPTARTLALAEAVIAGRVPDFVEGAVQWDAPRTQDRLHALYLRDPKRYPKYRRSSAEVAERRRAAGMREVRVDGVPNTRFWAKA
jgi:hypothetical protein